MQSLREICLRYVSLATLAYWQGGFTFYALVVVRAGNRLFGSVEQGFLTQQVTSWLNLTGTIVLLLLACDVVRWRRLPLVASWLTMAAGQATLWILHRRMDALLDPGSHEIGPGFYTLHAWYLTASTVAWLGGLAHLAFLLWYWQATDSLAKQGQSPLCEAPAAGREQTL